MGLSIEKLWTSFEWTTSPTFSLIKSENFLNILGHTIDCTDGTNIVNFFLPSKSTNYLRSYSEFMFTWTPNPCEITSQRSSGDKIRGTWY